MKRNFKHKKIIEMLESGEPYSSIQALLDVSPSTISMVKKKYFSSRKDKFNIEDMRNAFDRGFKNGSDSQYVSFEDFIRSIEK